MNHYVTTGNYSAGERLKAIQKLLKINQQLGPKAGTAVIQYREAGKRALIHMGGDIIPYKSYKGMRYCWDGQGIEVAELIAIVIKEGNYNSDGVDVEQFYQGVGLSSKGENLVKYVNQISLNVCGQAIFKIDPCINYIQHVDARGTML